MNASQLRARFPRASEDFIRENSTPDTPIRYAEPERHTPAALEKMAEGKEKGMGRVILRFIGYRVRPLDPDSFAGSTKDLIDGLRYAHLIRDDNFREIILKTTQVKVASFAEERTEVEITWP